MWRIAWGQRRVIWTVVKKFWTKETDVAVKEPSPGSHGERPRWGWSVRYTM